MKATIVRIFLWGSALAVCVGLGVVLHGWFDLGTESVPEAEIAFEQEEKEYDRFSDVSPRPVPSIRESGPIPASATSDPITESSAPPPPLPKSPLLPTAPLVPVPEVSASPPAVPGPLPPVLPETTSPPPPATPKNEIVLPEASPIEVVPPPVGPKAIVPPPAIPPTVGPPPVPVAPAQADKTPVDPTKLPAAESAPLAATETTVEPNRYPPPVIINGPPTVTLPQAPPRIVEGPQPRKAAEPRKEIPALRTNEPVEPALPDLPPVTEPAGAPTETPPVAEPPTPSLPAVPPTVVPAPTVPEPVAPPSVEPPPAVELPAVPPVEAPMVPVPPQGSTGLPSLPMLPEGTDPFPPIPEGSPTGDKVVPLDTIPMPLPVDGPGKAPIDRPLVSPQQPPLPTPVSDSVGLFQTTMDAPTGFSGRSSVIPRDFQTDPRFVPVEDRWRIGFPEYDRYGRGHPWVDDYLYLPGHWWDPYNQNVLKGDYPIAGQNIFLNLTAASRTITGPLQTPVATTPFESTSRPYQEQFFGSPNIGAMQQYFILSFDLFRGDTAVFRPIDWRLKVMPIFNVNYITVDELAVVNPDVRRGRQRGRSFLALEEWFFECKIADLGPNYDFVSVRAGSQKFNSDFRGLIFFDTNKGVRLFGTRNSNREQFNLLYFDMLEKDTNSFLNTFRDRGQNVIIGNYYVQDFIWPGYTAQWSFHYNRDGPSFHFDRNDTLVRPDPVGIFRPHGLDVFYLGWAGDGHINRFNINHAFYWALGRDSNNPIANRGVDINGKFAALELSYDRDYMRFRTSYLYSSGDRNPFDGTATGFDAILENPQFAGGEFSYWQRQAVRLFGINLTNIGSIVPAMKSSKIQGQSNFVNPGLHLVNFGVDIDITPRFRMINNVNLLWFDSPQVLRAYVYSPQIETQIGTDLSMGFEYRPFLNNNVIWKFGAAGLLPGRGFRDLFNNLRSSVDPLVAAFVDLELTY